jgi:hypothetical protein
MSRFLSDLCECPGCPNKHRLNSIYCCDKCQERAARIKAKHEYDNAYQTERRSKFQAAYPIMRPIEIRDPECGDPYRVTRTEFFSYRQAYKKLGIRVYEDGEEIVIE